jgi:hypothetical protein
MAKARLNAGMTTVRSARLMSMALAMIASVAIAAPAPTYPVAGADPGATTPLPNGGTLTTFTDGRSRAVAPYHPGSLSRKETDKDSRGRLLEIRRYDGQGRLRDKADYAYADGKIAVTFATFGENGDATGERREIVSDPEATTPPEGTVVLPAH